MDLSVRITILSFFFSVVFSFFSFSFFYCSLFSFSFLKSICFFLFEKRI